MHTQALVLVVAGLTGLAKLYGFGWLVKMYIVPYFVVNHWCVLLVLANALVVSQCSTYMHLLSQTVV